MALSFASGTMTLVNWGFSASDIALMAGAGRAAGTWLMAQIRDRGVLEFMGIDVDSVMTRKGLIDLVALHLRWDRKLRLLRNNQPVVIEHPGGSQNAVVDNMDRFTWIMVLIVGALDAAISSSGLTRVVSRFLDSLLKDSPIGTEYLQLELSRHIQGWHSSACVRGVLLRTRELWNTLGEEAKHWPGQMPLADEREAAELLLWLVAGEGLTFSTASSDVFCLAVILQDIGMEVSATTDANHTDDYRLRVYLNTSLTNKRQKSVSQKRWGMRIPLNFMQECVSLWPGDQGTNNRLRQLFEDGMLAVKKDGAIPVFLAEPKNHFFEIRTRYKPSERKRLGRLETRTAGLFLPQYTYEASECLGQIITAWTREDRMKFETLVSNSKDPREILLLDNLICKSALAELQVFLMGFYYKLLLPLLDFSRLSEAEAFGHWGYYDTAFLKEVVSFFGHFKREVWSVGRYEAWSTVTRQRALLFTAYLFAGAENHAFQDYHSSKTVGVIAKLSLLTNACLGRISTFRDTAKFCLLDVDTSCIPCNSSGIVTEGMAAPVELVEVDRREPRPIKLENIELSDGEVDYTSHVEPDWDHDGQTILVVFRHKGRLVYRMPPSMVESAYLMTEGKLHDPRTGRVGSQPTAQAPATLKHLYTTEIGQYHGGHVPSLSQTGMSLLIPTLGLPMARTCILGMYRSHYNTAVDRRDMDFVQVSSLQELKSAVEANFQYIVASEVMSRKTAKGDTRSELSYGSLQRCRDMEEASASLSTSPESPSSENFWSF